MRLQQLRYIHERKTSAHDAEDNPNQNATKCSTHHGRRSNAAQVIRRELKLPWSGRMVRNQYALGARRDDDDLR